MKPAPDGDVTPDARPRLDQGGAGDHRPSPRRVRRAARRHRLRRHHRARRCLRPLTRSTAAIVAAGGAIALRRVHAPRAVRRARLLHDRRAGRSARRLHHVAGGRAAVRRRARPVDRRGVAATRRARRLHGRRVPAPGRARWPGRSSPPRRSGATALRRRRGVGGAAARSIPTACESLADAARRAVSPVSSSPTSCSTTCRSAWPCSTAAGARRSSPPTATALREVLAAPLDPLPAWLPVARAARRPCPDPGRAAEWVRRRDRRARPAGGSSPSTTPSPAPPSWRRARGGSGCARTAATSAAATTSPTRARRTSPSRSALDQLPGARRGAHAGRSSSRAGRHRRAGREGRARVGTRRPRRRPVAHADDAQPGPRGRGAARPGRPRRLPGGLEWEVPSALTMARDVRG